jgi:hypothetical protein
MPAGADQMSAVLSTFVVREVDRKNDPVDYANDNILLGFLITPKYS